MSERAFQRTFTKIILHKEFIRIYTYIIMLNVITKMFLLDIKKLKIVIRYLNILLYFFSKCINCCDLFQFVV